MLSAKHLPYLAAEIIVGVLMITYVAFGGMKATTWVQIIKAGLLAVRRDDHRASRAGEVPLLAQTRCLRPPTS